MSHDKYGMPIVRGWSEAEVASIMINKHGALLDRRTGTPLYPPSQPRSCSPQFPTRSLVSNLPNGGVCTFWRVGIPGKDPEKFAQDQIRVRYFNHRAHL